VSVVRTWSRWAQPLLVAYLLVMMPLVLIVDEVIPVLILRLRRRWSGGTDR